MKSKQEVFARIKEDFAPLPEVEAACLLIAENIMSISPSRLRHLTQRNILRWLGGATEIDRLVKAICYLTGDRVPLLEMHFEFIDGDLVCPVDDEVLAEAEYSGVFVHPVEFVVVPDFKEKIFPYFLPTTFALSLNDSSRN